MSSLQMIKWQVALRAYIIVPQKVDNRYERHLVPGGVQMFSVYAVWRTLCLSLLILAVSGISYTQFNIPGKADVCCMLFGNVNLEGPI